MCLTKFILTSRVLSDITGTRGNTNVDTYPIQYSIIRWNNKPGLNVKITDRPVSSHILDKDSVTIHGELEHTLKYTMEIKRHNPTEINRNINGHKESLLNK